MLLILVTLCFHLVGCAIQLKCLNERSYSLHESITAEAFPLSKFGFGPSHPFAYDVDGRKRTVEHMWTSSNVDYFCSFKMNSFRVTSDGKLFKLDTSEQVIFDHPTMCGPYGSIYAAQMYYDWNAAIRKKTVSLESTESLHRDLVVPLRMAWDDCFNHLSFQSLPLIGAVLEIHGDLWDKLVWHTSLYGAAVVNAMGVPMSRIVVAQPVEADTLILPWIPHWLPVQLASVRGISKRACELFTEKLLAMSFPESKEVLNPLTIYSPTHRRDSNDTLISGGTDQLRYFVYITRSGSDSRDVYREKALLRMISEIVDTKKVKVVVVGHSHSYNSIVMLQRSWQRFAKIFSRAIVMMGPHGMLVYFDPALT